MRKPWIVAAVLGLVALAGCGSAGHSGWTKGQVAEAEAALKQDPSITAAGRACIIKGVESKIAASELKGGLADSKRKEVEAVTAACALRFKPAATTPESTTTESSGQTSTQTPEEKGAEIATQASEETAKEATPGSTSAARETREREFDEAEKRAKEIGGTTGEQSLKGVEVERKAAIEYEQKAGK